MTALLSSSSAHLATTYILQSMLLNATDASVQSFFSVVLVGGRGTIHFYLFRHIARRSEYNIVARVVAIVQQEQQQPNRLAAPCGTCYCSIT